MRRSVAFALLLLAAGCSETADINPRSPSGSGALVVTQELQTGGPLYIEGYVPFLTLTRDGQELFTERMRVDQSFTRNLPAGTYELKYVVHPCDANCGHLDPAAEECSLRFTLAAGQTLQAHAVERPGHSCSIQFMAA